MNLNLTGSKISPRLERCPKAWILLMDAESQQVEELKESLHEAGARNGTLVLQLREKDLVIEIMNEAHKLLIIEKNKLIGELADALERIPIGLTPPDRELLLRAREATK